MPSHLFASLRTNRSSYYLRSTLRRFSFAGSYWAEERFLKLHARTSDNSFKVGLAFIDSHDLPFQALHPEESRARRRLSYSPGRSDRGLLRGRKCACPKGGRDEAHRGKSGRNVRNRHFIIRPAVQFTPGQVFSSASPLLEKERNIRDATL